MPEMNVRNLEEDYNTFKGTDLSISQLMNDSCLFKRGMTIYAESGIELDYKSLPRKYCFSTKCFDIPIDSQKLALNLMGLPEDLFSGLNKAEDIDRTVKDILGKIDKAFNARSLAWHSDKLGEDGLSDESRKKILRSNTLMCQLKLAKELLIYQLQLNHANYRKFGYLPWHLTGFNNLKNILDVILFPTKVIAGIIYSSIEDELVNAAKAKGASLNKKEKLVSIIKSLKWPLILAVPGMIILISFTALLLLSPFATIPLTMGLVKLAPVPIILLVKFIRTALSMIKSFIGSIVSAVETSVDFTVSAIKKLAKYLSVSKVTPINAPLITYYAVYAVVPTLTTEPNPVDTPRAGDRQPAPYSYTYERRKMGLCK